MTPVELQEEHALIRQQARVHTRDRFAHTETSQNAARRQSCYEVFKLLPKHMNLLRIEQLEEVLELWRQLVHALEHFLSRVVVGQTLKRLKQDGELLKFVPEGQD